MSTVEWRFCLVGWCERADTHTATLHVVMQPDGRWEWECFPTGYPRGGGLEDDKATAQRRAVEHAERAVAAAEGQHGSEEEGGR